MEYRFVALEDITCVDCGAVICEEGAQYDYAEPNGNWNLFVTAGGVNFYRVDGGYICEEDFNDGFVICDCCWDVVRIEDSRRCDDEDISVCDCCYERDYFTCADCGQVLSNDYQVSVNGGGDYLCQSCVDSNDNIYYCDECGEAFTGDNMNRVANGGNVCTSCTEGNYTYCDNCEEYYPSEDVFTCSEDGVYDDCSMCRDCINDSDISYDYCEGCGRMVNTEHLHDVNGTVRCDRCVEMLSRSGSTGFREAYEEIRLSNGSGDSNSPDYLPPCKILSYHNNTPRVFLSIGDETMYRGSCRYDLATKRYYGIELEVECNSHDNASVSTRVSRTLNTLNHDENGKAKNHWTAMHDGSLSSIGFELISQPMTAEYFDKNALSLLKKACSEMVKAGVRSHDTRRCGLHFHVTRDSLTDECMVNMEMILYRFRDVATKIARRTGDQLQQWSQFKSMSCDYTAEVELTKYNTSKPRYRALNFNNRDTVELRICNGTLRVKSFLGCLHFMRFLVDISEKLSFDEVISLDRSDFIKAMTDYSPELKEYMAYRGLIPAQDTSDIPEVNVGGEDETDIEPSTLAC